MYHKFFREVIREIKSKRPNKKSLNRIKSSLCRKYKLPRLPTDIEILLNCRSSDIKSIRKYLYPKHLLYFWTTLYSKQTFIFHDNVYITKRTLYCGKTFLPLRKRCQPDPYWVVDVVEWAQTRHRGGDQ